MTRRGRDQSPLDALAPSAEDGPRMRSSVLVVLGVLAGLGLGCSATATSSQSVASASGEQANAPLNRMPPKVIQEVVQGNFNQLSHCYEDGLRRDRMLFGRVSVRFVINSQGRVENLGAAKVELRDPAVANCVVEAFRPLQFPAPMGGFVTVVYPLLFSPGEEQRTSGECVLETKTQGVDMIYETERCKGFAVMNTVLSHEAPVDEAFALGHLKGFEGGAVGTRAGATVAGKPGWSSVVAGGNGQPYRKLLITQYDKGAAQLVSCQDEEASDASERCEKAIEERVREHQK